MGADPTSADAPAGFSRAPGLVAGWPRHDELIVKPLFVGTARPEPYLSRRDGSIGEKAMRSILALSLLITLYGSANAATVHHAHRRHAIVCPNQGMIASDPASGFVYAPPEWSIQAPYNLLYSEPYFGASQGYAPGEKQRFLDSVRRGG
jgi:hypothetical protein